MVFVNLLPENQRRRHGHLVKPFIIVTLSLVLIGIVSFFTPVRKESKVRPLSTEERETVVSSLGQIRLKVPELSQWASEFGTRFEQDSFPSYVEMDLREDGLARVEADTVFFTPEFFSADSVEQERALVRLVVDSVAPWRLDMETELAVRPTE